jgi:hypothetical protein
MMIRMLVGVRVQMIERGLWAGVEGDRAINMITIMERAVIMGTILKARGAERGRET